jgi:hypothetical protein
MPADEKSKRNPVKNATVIVYYILCVPPYIFVYLCVTTGKRQDRTFMLKIGG